MSTLNDGNGEGSGSFMFQRAINSRLYAHALGVAYRNGVEVYDPDYALAQDPEYWEKVQRDAVIKHAFEQRLHSVAGRDWSVVAGKRNPRKIDEDAAMLGEEIIDLVRGFTQSRYHLAKGVFLGETWGYMNGRRVPMTIGGKLQNWWMPTHISDIDKRRIRPVPSWNDQRPAGEKLQMRYELHDLESATWAPIHRNAPLIHFSYDNEESRLSHGRGLAEAIYFYHYAKGVVLREGLEGLEKWARGIVVAKIKSSSSSPLDNEEVRDAYLAKLEDMRQGGSFAMDVEDELDVLWAGGAGHSQVFEWLRYLDEGITQLILGAVLPSGGGSDVGSNARAETEAETSETLVGYDRTVLYEALSDQMMRAIWYWNRKEIANLGLADAFVPRMTATSVDSTNPTETATQVATILQAGIPLVKSEVYDRLGWTMPTDSDDVIEGIEPPVDPLSDLGIEGQSALASIPSMGPEGGA